MVQLQEIQNSNLETFKGGSGGRNRFTNALTGAAIGGLVTGNIRGAAAGGLLGAVLGGKKKSRTLKTKKRSRSKSPRKSPKKYRYNNQDPFSWSKSKFNKHMERKSPFLSANANCGKTMRGNDETMWISTRNKNGICTWKRMKNM